MKGLFVKDLKLMMLQKNFLLLILAIVIGMMIFTDDVIFPLGFLSFIVSLFTVSTISYDDFDNGNAFLFTLPITRNHYVSEKYFLGLLLGCMAWVLATVLGIITTVLKDTLPITDLVQSSLMILPIMIVVQAITLPFLLKFGGDKGRIAMIGAFGGLAVITLVIVKGAEAIFNIDLVSLLDNLPTVSMGVLIAIAIIIALLMLLVSMKISLSIMNKKNFKKEQVFTKEQIYENVWGYDYPADPNNLTSFIRKLRKKIEPEPDRPRYIVTVRGVGYKYTENEEMVGKTATPPE